MSWAAANVPRHQGLSEGVTAPASIKESKKRGETVEAVLSRLSKAYSLAMECFGAMHAASEGILKKKTDELNEESLLSLKKVAVAARNTLEKAVLLDPLIVAHSPTLRSTIQQFADRDGAKSEKWKVLCASRAEPPKISSKAHRATIRQLAYLSLTNYADLLTSVCTCSFGRTDYTRESKKILDKGVVQKLKGFSDNFSVLGCCWCDESEEDTQRLALCALCDASSLDGSDPVVWVKLACAARAMGHIMALPNRLSNPTLSAFRRLERHAIEKGYTALPPSLPPNRLIAKISDEFNDEQPPKEYPPVLSKCPEPLQLSLDLTRYSWASLGRILMKACREGLTTDDKHNLHMSNAQHGVTRFASPLISLNISPMLLLPSNVLSTLLSFLENDSIWKLEATCRALSVSTMSVRAAIEKQDVTKLSYQQETPPDEAMQEQKEEVPVSDKGGTEIQGGAAPQAADDPTQHEERSRIGRSSKRVRSQQISSDKKDERLRKRNSVPFCLCAATLSCTADDEPYKSGLRTPLSWDSIKGESWKLPASEENLSVPQKGRVHSVELSRRKNEALERTGNSSLSSFLHQWNLHNAGPVDMLLNYLGHVALHVEEVFLVDPADTMVLTSCIMTGFDLLLQRKFQNSLLPEFFNPELDLSKDPVEQSLRLLAVDLLHTEIRFKRCERQQQSYVDFDDDLNFVSCMVPNLLYGIDRLETVSAGTDFEANWMKLKTRTFWLAAGVFLWRSRFTNTVYESIKAEEEGLKYIQSTIECLGFPVDNPVRTILTPHLESPGRSGAHWKKLCPEALAAYRDEIQASSVVSLAQQELQERIAVICKRNIEGDDVPMEDADVDDLNRIGESLIIRYEVPFGEAGYKHGELLDNFLLMHGDEYFSSPLDAAQDVARDKLVPLSVDIPNLAEMTNPSILTILVSCLNVKSENRIRVIVLLVRLVLTTLDRHEQVCSTGMAGIGGDGRHRDTFSDSDDDGDDNNSTSNDATMNEIGGGSAGYAFNALKYGRFAKFLIKRMREILVLLRDEEERLEMSRSDEFLKMLHHTLAFCSKWVDYFTQQPSIIEESLDLEVFREIQSLVNSFSGLEASGEANFLGKLYFRDLVRLICSQQQSFSSLVRVQGTVRARRAVRQRICVSRAKFIGTVFCVIGNVLSMNLADIWPGRMSRSNIVDRGFGDSSKDLTSETTAPAEIFRLCNALLWFWNYSGASKQQSDASISSSFDRPIIERLRIPLAVAIIGFCGSSSCTRELSTKPKAEVEDEGDRDNRDDRLCLAEFFDSDASVHDLSGDEDEEEKTKERGSEIATHSQRELLRVISHVVHCVGLVFGKFDEKEIISFDDGYAYTTSHGPMLPLVVSRVLNHIGDAVLQHFQDDDESDPQGIWSDEYPFATRSIGILLDSALYKAYKCLHGFTIVGINEQHSIKDNVSPTTSDIETKRFAPESTAAAARLYRCIIRARKKPPKAALEMVSAALPPLEESEKTGKIREFLFTTAKHYFDVDDIVSIVTKAPRWDIYFDAVTNWDQHDKQTSDMPSDTGGHSHCSNDEVMRVRKGIFSLLAQGDLPAYSSGHGGKDDERSNAARFERELAKKFDAILNNLSYGDTADIRGWLRAAQCLILKSEAIADRLGLSKGFTRNEDFCIPEEGPPLVQRLDIATLKEQQEKEQQRKDLGWIHHLGGDLSYYIHCEWSNFSSLEALSRELAKGKAEGNENSTGIEDECKAFETQVKKDIHDMQDKGRLAEWQQAWGGMFVSALRKVAVRCICLALYLAHNHGPGMSSDDKNLIPELLETLGVKLYIDLSGSQNYGYPMHVMTQHRKRQLAVASIICFESAVDLSNNGDDKMKDDEKELWDLRFMIGKCYEKISSTFKLEKYDRANATRRQYEQNMEKALDNYHAAIEEQPKDSGEMGGSSHGKTEILYRLHAARLKCLLIAVNTHEDERELAEEEALRITEKYWFSPPDNPAVSLSPSVRDRVWKVLSDVIAGLAQCRLEHNFFHRSVYRHAQALMWAPLLNDPIVGRVEGGKGTVPATKSYHLRGLNHATDAASSAYGVIKSLFDRKRAQLVAVWVTTTYPPSTFETLNDSVRKYDSLRGKYISAYVDILRICGKRDELETLLRWVSSSKRDLPSYFQASALTKGGRPEKSHNHDSLLVKSHSISSNTFLTTLKRKTNSALADTIIQELNSKDVKSIENHLKLAYACYLRLNCSIRDLRKTRAWKYGRGGVREAEALCEAFLKLNDRATVKVDPNDWSGGGKKAAVLEAAVQKCKELFPSLSGTFYTKKATQKTKNQNDKDGMESSPTKGLTNNAGTKRSFEVEVPEGLSEGATFTTTIRSGENSKKVKLTVPSGKPRMLRFSLDLDLSTKQMSS